MADQTVSFCCLITLATFLLFGAISFVDGASFTSPSGKQDKYETAGQDATFTFGYQVEALGSLQNIFCGYRGASPSTNIIAKVGTQPSAITSNFRNRAQKGIDTTTQIGFKLLKVQLNDAGEFGCDMTYANNQIFSNYFVLKIYEAPRFGDCLGPEGTKFIIREGQALNTTCAFYGNPQPTLTCEILDASSGQLSSNNLGSSNRTSLNPILIYNIARNSKFVKCTASHPQTTPAAVRQRQLVVQYQSSAPRDLKKRASTYSAITVQWLPPLDFGNAPLISYQLEIEDSRPLHYSKNVTNSTLAGSTPSLEHTFDNLDAQVEYKISVVAYTDVGKGTPSGVEIFKTVPYTPTVSGGRSSSNTGAIVGGVIGGLVFIVIIVAIVVWYRRREPAQKYPQSFVEEAVDYPAAKSNMYSKVNKKKMPTSLEDESTSGYPDIIHQANADQRPHNPENQSLRADNPQDTSTSPSYESSRKEYV
eukprot:gene11432-12625_t